jgi:hypothetical protein
MCCPTVRSEKYPSPRSCFDSRAPRAPQSPREHSPSEEAVADAPVPPGTASSSFSVPGVACPARAVVSRAQAAAGPSSPVPVANDRRDHARGTSPAWNRDRGRCSSAVRDRHRRPDRASHARAHPPGLHPISPGSSAATSTPMVFSACFDPLEGLRRTSLCSPSKRGKLLRPLTARSRILNRFSTVLQRCIVFRHGKPTRHAGPDSVSYLQPDGVMNHRCSSSGLSFLRHANISRLRECAHATRFTAATAMTVASMRMVPEECLRLHRTMRL